MEFGRVTTAALSDINFHLPKEPLMNEKILPGPGHGDPKIYLGCGKWGRTEWLGKIYPLKTKEKDFLAHYVQHYNSIELNATHYKLYGPAGISKWVAKTEGRDFIFCPKMYQAVTHRGKLKTKGFLTNEFLRGVRAFREHLGPVFIQVSDKFGPKRKEELFAYLRTLPSDMSFFLEVRHAAWYADEVCRNELMGTLRQLGIGSVITDTAGRRDCCHMELSIPKTFIRFVGNSLHPTDYIRIDDWVERIGYWLKKGIDELYFFMHMHDEAYSPELSAYMVDKLNDAYGLQLIKPKFINSGAQSGIGRSQRLQDSQK